MYSRFLIWTSGWKVQNRQVPQISGRVVEVLRAAGNTWTLGLQDFVKLQRSNTYIWELSLIVMYVYIHIYVWICMCMCVYIVVIWSFLGKKTHQRFFSLSVFPLSVWLGIHELWGFWILLNFNAVTRIFENCYHELSCIFIYIYMYEYVCVYMYTLLLSGLFWKKKKTARGFSHSPFFSCSGIDHVDRRNC